MEKITVEELKKYFESLFIFTWLTIILTSFALNRLSILILKDHLLINFPFRVYLEHFLTGYWIILASLFFVYTGSYIHKCLIREKFSFFGKGWEIFAIILTSLIYLYLEIYYQFFMQYNKDSWFQIIFSILGLTIGFIVYYKQNRKK